MPFFIVICKSIKNGLFLENTKNPSQSELKKDIKNSAKIYLLSSLEVAGEVAELFFQAPAVLNGGSYGLIAEVACKFPDYPIVQPMYDSEIYNNCVDRQKLGSGKKEPSVYYLCIVVKPEHIQAILKSYIPAKVLAYNTNLANTDYSEVKQDGCRCIIL